MGKEKKARLYGNTYTTAEETRAVLCKVFSRMPEKNWKLHAGKDNFWWVQWEKESDYDTFPVGKWFRVDRQLESLAMDHFGFNELLSYRSHKKAAI
jgi:hypothetical protein